MCCLTSLRPVLASTENGENECEFANDGKYFFEIDDLLNENQKTSGSIWLSDNTNVANNLDELPPLVMP